MVVNRVPEYFIRRVIIMVKTNKNCVSNIYNIIEYNRIWCIVLCIVNTYNRISINRQLSILYNIMFKYYNSRCLSFSNNFVNR